MIKKCIGCGLELQTEDKTKLGYTPDIKNVYCMRCFRLKNYGEKKESEFVNEEEIILKVNRSKGVIFFLIDYLNLNKYTLNIFKSLNLPKVLVISKADTLRRDMKFNKIKRWLSSVYNIGEDIIFMSNKNDFKNFNIFKYMDKLNIRNCYIMGITNAGKSTYINSLLKNNHIKKEIITSNKPNTTLDFIKIRINDYVIYDTPGFDYLNLNSKIIEKEIKPLTYSLKGDTTIVINNIYELYFKDANNITIYTTHKNVEKVFKNIITRPISNDIRDNYDVVIPGIGFINVKKNAQILSNFEILEMRPNISGEEYE